MKSIRFVLLFFFAFITVSSNAANTIQQFKLSQVKLLDGPFLNAQQVDMKYILALDPDRLLAPYLKDAGIKPLKEQYGNWEC
jgi:uncharacterized protein